MTTFAEDAGITLADVGGMQEVKARLDAAFLAITGDAFDETTDTQDDTEETR